MEQLKLIPFIFLMIGISAIIGGAMAIVLSEFGESIDTCFNTSYFYNTTTQTCMGVIDGPTNITVTTGDENYSESYYVIVEGQSGVSAVAEQLSTIAIIGVMVIIIGLISSVFVYFKYFY